MKLPFVPPSIRFQFPLKKAHSTHSNTHGFTTSSVIKISNNCPDAHVIEGVGNFETKGYMPIDRKVTWGKVKIQVKN